MSGAEERRVRVRDVALFFRRQWRVVAGVTLIVMALTVIATLQQAPTYRSSAEVALESAANAGEVQRLLFGENELGTEQRILTSRVLARQVLEEQGLPSTDAAAKRFIQDHLVVQNEPGTTVLKIIVTAEERQRARTLAQGVAEGYLAYVQRDAAERLERALGELRGQEAVVRQRLQSVQQELSARPPVDIADSLERDRDQLYEQLRFVASRATELRTTNAFARRATIIEPATAAAAPASPKPALNTALGLMVGLLLGLAAAVIRDVSQDRVGDDTGVDGLGVGRVLATVPAPAVGGATAGEAADAAFRRLRSGFLAESASAGTTGASRLVAFIPLKAGDGAAVVMSLGEALARSGRRVVVVDADVANAPLTPGGPPDRPGLAQLLRDDDGPSAARTPLQVAGGVHLLPAGVDMGASDLLSGPRFRRVLDALAAEYDHVLVVQAPLSAPEGIDAVGQVANAVLVASATKTRKAALRGAGELLRSAGSHVVGVVLTRPVGRRAAAGMASAAVATRPATTELASR